MKKLLRYLLCSLFLFVTSVSLYGMEEQKNGTQLLLLNGASCAGKTSLAKALVAAAKEKGMINIEHMSFDEVFVNVSNDPWYIDKQIQYYQELGYPVFSDIREKQSKQRTDQYFGLFYQQILERIRDGKIIVADHCFSTKESFLDFLEAFYAFHKDIALVKVFCDYSVAKQRFNKRNNGDDQTQHRQDWCFEQHYSEPKKSTIYEDKLYHAELDTSTITPEEGAEKLMHFFDVSFQQDGTTNIVRKNYEESRSKIDHRYAQSDCLVS